jgi:hypothetical protein
MQDRISQVDEKLLQRTAGPYIGGHSRNGGTIPRFYRAVSVKADREVEIGSVRRRRATEQRDELAPFHCPMLPVLPTERIAYLSYGRRPLRCRISLLRFRVENSRGTLPCPCAES